MSLTKQGGESLYRVVMVLTRPIGPCCYKLRAFDVIKEETKLSVTHFKPIFHLYWSR